MQISDLGERELLKRLQQFCPRDIIGDDGAVLAVPPSQSLVVTTDTLVNGVHFSPQTTSAEDVGWRAVAANLSDLAAMGATPLGITVSLALPRETELAWLDGLYQGMVACLEVYATPLVGGDLCRASEISLNITALGSVASAIYRHQARVGDAIVVSGVHGASRAGLELLLNDLQWGDLDPQIRENLISAHQRPRPRLDLLEPLQRLGIGRIAGMDSSDGLGDAVIQLAHESGVKAQLWGDRLPSPPGLSAMVPPDLAQDWVLWGGEDFELVLCLAPEDAKRLVDEVAGLAIIGEMVAGMGAELQLRDRIEILAIQSGFRHF
ncbi:thiamine-phosphate kinase [Sodalinema gerasimenkoae]|uniref:thiamine-phosphate kinase n=1 Tax=Sodalinema gerasimenkoae TaxID=2862348 RepID=UPI0013577605|nr:thiamine-phosphate kinase [Sodalinema gerasimenkoae]